MTKKYSDYNNEICTILENSFKGQQKESRPELLGISFQGYLRETTSELNNIKYLMNKNQIKKFAIGLESKFGNYITKQEDTSSEYYASELLKDILIK